MAFAAAIVHNLESVKDAAQSYGTVPIGAVAGGGSRTKALSGWVALAMPMHHASQPDAGRLLRSTDVLDHAWKPGESPVYTWSM